MSGEPEGRDAPPPELLPCPFCGGPALIERNYDDPTEQFVRCQSCGATVGSVFDDSPCADEDTPAPTVMLTNAWNRRGFVRSVASESANSSAISVVSGGQRPSGTERRGCRKIARVALQMAYKLDGVTRGAGSAPPSRHYPGPHDFEESVPVGAGSAGSPECPAIEVVDADRHGSQWAHAVAWATQSGECRACGAEVCRGSKHETDCVFGAELDAAQGEGSR